MKITSLLILVIVLSVFFFIQGWIVIQKFAIPEELASTEAILSGVSIEVGTPVSGLIENVLVQEGDSVKKEQTLFTIAPQSADQPEGKEVFTVRAEREGIITDIAAIPGTFAQSSQQLARIVDTSSEAITIYAKLHVPPTKLGYLPDIYPSLSATVQASYLNNNKPIAATVESVELEYDAQNQTIGVSLRLHQVPAELENFPVGLPLDVRVQLAHKRPLQQFIQTIRQASR